METTRDFFETLSKGLSQMSRLLKLDTPLGEDVLLPHRLIAEDHLGRGYTYTLDVLSEKNNLELKRLIAQPVTLWIQQTDTSLYAPVHGYVHRAKKLGFDGKFAFYQIQFCSWLHFLKRRKDARIWQDKSASQIITEVFLQYPEAGGNFRFSLERSPIIRSYCTQYDTDWNFVMRLMEEEGWFCYHEQSANGQHHTVVIVDTVRKLPDLTPKAIEFHRAGVTEDTGKITHWSSERQLISQNIRTTTFDYKAPGHPKNPVWPNGENHGAIPKHLEVFEYTGAYTFDKIDHGRRQARNTMEAWQSMAKRYFAQSSVRRMTVGHCFVFEGHTDHPIHPPLDREFMVIGLNWFIENNLPAGVTSMDFPGSLKPTIDEIKQQTVRYGADITEREKRNHHGNIVHSMLRGFCLNQIEVQRSQVEYRPLREHKKPVMHPQSAIVVGPEQQEIYTDALNRVKIKFLWDRLNPGNQGASCWVRVVYPTAGNGYGAVHVPRVGQEVIVSFLDGDPDRPIITGQVYNGWQKPHWHSNGKLSGMKSKEYQGKGFNQLVMDDHTGQNRVQLYSSHTNAQLNLGHLVAQTDNQRGPFYGSGFALNTDAYGAVTAHQGLYLGTYRSTGATGSQLAVTDAHQQLQASHELTKSLSETAVQAKAEPLAGQEALQHFIDAMQENYDEHNQQQANRFKAPILLAASPAGIGLTTPESTHLHSGNNITLSSGTDTNIATGKSLVASIAEKLSLFVYNAGIKLFAAKGKVEIQAQSDDLDIIAEKVLRLISTHDKIELWAKKEITLGAAGSAIKINADGITDFTTGQRIMHHAMWSLPGPKSLFDDMPILPKTECIPCMLNAARGSYPLMRLSP